MQLRGTAFHIAHLFVNGSVMLEKLFQLSVNETLVFEKPFCTKVKRLTCTEVCLRTADTPICKIWRQR